MSSDRSLTRENIGYLLAKASQRWNELLYERFREAGLAEVRPAFGSLLVPLYEEEGLRMGELARRARLSKQAMTNLVRRAEAAALVHRVGDERDRRAARVYLTERARAFRPVAEAVLRELDELLEAHLGAAKLRQLRQSLKGVIEL